MKRQIKFMSWMLLVAMLLGIMPPQLRAYAAKADRKLSKVTASVSQNGSDIKPGDAITPIADLTVSISFDVPGLTGDSANPLQAGDMATINLTKDFSLVSDGPVSLMNGDVSVGQVNVQTDPETKMVIAQVVFDVADPTLVESMNNTFDFSTKLKYNSSGEAGKSGDHLVKILEENYTVTVLSVESEVPTQSDIVSPADGSTQPEATQPEEGSTQPVVTIPEESSQPIPKPGTPLPKPAGTIPMMPAKPSQTIQSEVYSLLENIVSVVSQKGVVVPVNGNLTSTDPIKVAISFDVPVAGDDPTPDHPVQKGDTAVFELSNAFKLPSVGTLPLEMGGITIGHLTFSTNSTGVVIATVVFDGADTVFEDYNSVKVQFSANFDYNNDGSAGNYGEHAIKILEKNYTVTVPTPPIIYTVTKTGSADLASGKINWSVVVTATQGGKAIDLKGYKFVDNLSGVGPFVPGSFKVGGVPVDPVTIPSPIAYVFPENSVSPQTILFATTIPDAKVYGTGQQTVNNTAQLYETTNNQLVKEGSASVKFTPQWISKSGIASDAGSSGIYDPINRTITWTITANLSKLALNNVVITDVLKGGLTFGSATMQIWNGTAWGASSSITPIEAGKYAIGNINSMVRLTIVSKVPDKAYEAGITTYQNSANMTWDGSTGVGPGTGSIGVGVGYNATSKSGTPDPKTGIINWTMNVNTKGQEIPQLKVYDLLVYGTTPLDLATVTGFPAGLDTTKLVPQYNQAYITGSFNGQGLQLASNGIFQSGKRVADLIEVSGFVFDQANPFTFKTQVVNPDIFAGNKTTPVKNTITLHSALTKINQADASVNYKSQMLSKEMLKREANADPSAGVNSQMTTDVTAAFDYNDKSVIYRLTVNADAMNLTNMMDASVKFSGMVTLTDTLPEGWTFVPFDDSNYYLRFEGEKSGDTVNAVGPAINGDSAFNLSIGGRTAAFMFQPLTKPYVILLKARPTDSVLAEYFTGNKTSTVTNTLALKTENWQIGPSVTRNVSIKSELFGKSQTKVADGVLNWTVEYKPYDITGSATRIEDLIPQGLALRIDSTGNLLLPGNITVTELILQPDGKYSAGGLVTLVPGDNINYSNTTRILSFKIPDSAKAYRLNYITDITGEEGTVSNKATLYGGSTKVIDASVAYVISSADASASLKKNGWIEIAKQDGSNKALAGVTFTLFASDGMTVIRKGNTAANGTLRFKVIPDGDYILRETATLTGYTLDTQSHSVKITTVDGVITTSIDGKTGKDSNLITIKNFLENTVGGLILRKSVDGNGGDLNKKFEFTVTFTGATGTYDYFGTGVPNGTIKNGDKVYLANGQSIKIVGLPKGSSYNVIETDYSAESYVTESMGETGTIMAGETNTAAFINTRNLGELTLSKSVTGNAGDPDKLFEFKITFNGAPLTYNYTGNGVLNGAIKSGDTISLKGGQSITIAGLPVGATYSVTEADYSGIGYVTTSTGKNGTIAAGQPQTAAFTNAKNIGSLKITKSVPGKTSDKNKKFVFTITLIGAPGVYSYVGTGVSNGTIQSGGTVSLADGQSILINGLPSGATYIVTEANYLADGYESGSTGADGTIVTGQTQTAAFTNTKIEGELILFKSVTGNGGNLDKTFDFTVVFEDKVAVYPYTGFGVTSGTIKSGDTIALAHGQSIMIEKLPQVSAYSVTEADYSGEGYVLSKTGDSGLIVADEPQIAAFINTKNVGSLTVSKTVQGNAGDKTKLFKFTITVKGAEFVYAYTGTGVDDGTFRNGDSFFLMDGQSITIDGLPADATYTVVEADYWPQGYVTSKTEATGTIQTKQTKTAAFTNTKNIGSLEITKTVPGKTSDKTKAFEFTVTFTGAPGEYAYEGTGGAIDGTIQSGGTVSLTHGQSILIKGLPADATYSVVETSYFADGYIPEMSGNTGIIETDETQVADFKNIKVVGELVISKTVNGNDGDPTKPFAFTVTFEGTTGSFAYTGNGVDSGMIKSGDTIFLAHGQSIMISGLPKDIKYMVVEADFSSDGYVTEATGDTGTIVADVPQHAAFTNTRNIGSLAITKTVPGITADKTKAFSFTITFGDAPATYTYIGTNIADGTIQSGDTITLTDGQSILINGLPAGTTYTVVEADYLADGYVAVSTDATGLIATDETKTAAFINNKVEGELTITKTVAGNDGDRQKKFNFTVTFQGADGSYPYTGDGVDNGTIKSGETIALGHGQSIMISKLPMDSTYTIVEQDYSYEGYVVEKSGDVGTIVADEPQAATFTNTKNIGSLTITKTVPGKTSDKTKTFDFTVTFIGAPAEYTYAGNGVPNGTIKSGDTISLADGQSITIVGLPEHASYEVTEKDYTGEGYIPVMTGDSGTIITAETQVADFTNIKIVGELVISKTVKGNGGDPTKQFAFTVTFENTTGAFPYKGNGVPDGTIQSGDTILLTHGQSIMISGLPKDVKFKVVEADYSVEGYILEQTGEVGTIVADQPQIAAFFNTKNIGSLAIEKMVKGNGGETNRSFKFTVTFYNAPGAYAYQKNGVDAGMIRSGDTVSLAHGQIITINGLPTGASYVVTEADYSAEGYSEAKIGDAGTIATGETSTAAFVNTKEVGSLSISKILKGAAPNRAKAFEFTVILEGTSAAYSYVGNGVPNGKIKSGDKIALANGQSITINGLPVGMNYSVTEKDYLRSGFEVVSSGATGKIRLDQIQQAIFTNTYNAELDFNIPDKPDSELPQTGDTLIGNYAKIGLFFFSGAFLSLAAAYYVLRKRQLNNRH